MSAVPTGTKEELSTRLRVAERAALEAGRQHAALLKRLEAEGYPAMWQSLQQFMTELGARRDEIRALQAALLHAEVTAEVTAAAAAEVTAEVAAAAAAAVTAAVTAESVPSGDSR